MYGKIVVTTFTSIITIDYKIPGKTSASIPIFRYMRPLNRKAFQTKTDNIIEAKSKNKNKNKTNYKMIIKEWLNEWKMYLLIKRHDMVCMQGILTSNMNHLIVTFIRFQFTNIHAMNTWTVHTVLSTHNIIWNKNKNLVNVILFCMSLIYKELNTVDFSLPIFIPIIVYKRKQTATTKIQRKINKFIW